MLGEGKSFLSKPLHAAAVLMLLALTTLSATTGCGAGDSVSTVEGVVTVDDQPVPDGTINFTPLQSSAAPPIAVEIHDGRYHSTQVPRGKLMAHIISMQDTGEKIYELGVAYPKMKNRVPDRYQPGIELTVDAPTMTHDFKLTTE